MRHALLISVAAVALAAGSTLALSQGTNPAGAPGGSINAPAATPGSAAPSAAPNAAPSGQGVSTEKPAPGKGAKDRTIPEKQKSTQQAPAKPAPQQQGQATPQPGQAAPAQQTQAPQGGSKQGQAAPHQQPGQAAPAQQSQGQSTTGTKQGTAERPMTSKNVSFTTEQKTTIRKTVLTSSAPRVTTVNFDIKVGTVVPRTVRVVPLPMTIVEIEPTWRGYMYFVRGDEIIVVDPRTLQIVAVLEV